MFLKACGGGGGEGEDCTLGGREARDSERASLVGDICALPDISVILTEPDSSANPV